uniref:Serine/threonine-protein kinase MARK1-like n=1 Tax=Saccoglossus kowalevskii TaxID=10224 RepID=A0ABM0MEK8_SACKO|nr:PREDICTED: serine/threonine-protein kinase MARK1-like [Saccoglossus kowalevskii]
MDGMSEYRNSVEFKKRGESWVPHRRKSALESLGYTLGETIGEGQYSKVKKAYTKVTQNCVAVKQLSKQLAPRDIATKFFSREFACLKKVCGHPNIIAVYDAVETDKTLYFIMEYAPNGDLLDFINTHGHLEEEEARTVFKQLISAIAFCHQKGIAHRDIKCDNILLDEKYNVKLTDFGFSTLMPRSGFMQTHCGSYVYTAPEILEGVKYDGQKADIWSMGVVLYSMLCGRLPFKDTDLTVLLASMRERVHFHNRVSKDCRDIVRAMLTLDPDRRITLEQLVSMDWLTQPIDRSTLSHGSPAASLLSIGSTDSVIVAMTNLNAEHGLSCSQHVYKGAKPTLVSDVLKAVAVRHSAGECQEQLFPQHVSSHVSKTGLVGPAARRISVQISQQQLNHRVHHVAPVAKGNQLRRMSLGIGVVQTPQECKAALRRGSVVTGNSQIHMAPAALMDSVTRLRENQIEKERQHLRFSLSSKAAKSAGGKRKKDAECTRRTSLVTDAMKAGTIGTEHEQAERELIARFMTKLAHCGYYE